MPGANRTLVLYAHYDGQPVTAADWKSTEPFTPQLYSNRLDRGGQKIAWPAAGATIDPDWRFYGRAASDDKLGVYAILSAVDALKAANRQLLSLLPREAQVAAQNANYGGTIMRG